MKPRDHLERARSDFAAGRPRYWAKPENGQKLERLRANLSELNRRHKYGFRFNIDRTAVMVSPPKG